MSEDDDDDDRDLDSEECASLAATAVSLLPKYGLLSDSIALIRLVWLKPSIFCRIMTHRHSMSITNRKFTPFHISANIDCDMRYNVIQIKILKIWHSVDETQLNTKPRVSDTEYD